MVLRRQHSCEQLTVLEIGPVLLKNEERIKALLILYFIAPLMQSLNERELRLAMNREEIEQLPLYPEERANHRPTAEQILRLFSLKTGTLCARTTMKCRPSNPSSPTYREKSFDSSVCRNRVCRGR